MTTRHLIVPLALVLGGLLLHSAVRPRTAAADEPELVFASGARMPANCAGVTDLMAPLWTNVKDKTLQSITEPVAYWGRLWEPTAAKLIVLRDGSVLVADLLELNERELKYGLDPFDFGALPVWRDGAIDRRWVAGAILHPPPDIAALDRLLDRLLSAADTDELILVNGDSIQGKVLAPNANAILNAPPQDAAESAAREQPNNTERVVLIESDQQQIQAPWSRVQAIALQGSAAEPAPAGAWLGLRDGSLVFARRLPRQQDDIVLGVLGDAQLKIPDEELRRRLAYYEPVVEGVTDADRLPVLSYRHIPFLQDDAALPLRLHRNVRGLRMRVAGVWRRKGLGLPSASRIAFDIPQGANRFVTEAAIDDLAKGRGSATIRIYLQQAEQWTLALESDILRGGQSPLTLLVELGQSQRIAILVDYADRGDVLDYVNLIGPRSRRDGHPQGWRRRSSPRRARTARRWKMGCPADQGRSADLRSSLGVKRRSNVLCVRTVASPTSSRLKVVANDC